MVYVLSITKIRSTQYKIPIFCDMQQIKYTATLPTRFLPLLLLVLTCPYRHTYSSSLAIRFRVSSKFQLLLKNSGLRIPGGVRSVGNASGLVLEGFVRSTLFCQARPTIVLPIRVCGVPIRIWSADTFFFLVSGQWRLTRSCELYFRIIICFKVIVIVIVAEKTSVLCGTHHIN